MLVGKQQITIPKGTTFYELYITVLSASGLTNSRSRWLKGRYKTAYRNSSGVFKERQKLLDKLPGTPLKQKQR